MRDEEKMDLLRALQGGPGGTVEPYPTLRDQFAMAALVCLRAPPHMSYEEARSLAWDAYWIADAMLDMRTAIDVASSGEAR